MNKSSRLFVKAKRLLVGGVNSPVRAFKAVGGNPFFVARGRGARLWDVDGKSYIDYVGSWGPLILGHAHSSVRQAAALALQRGNTFGAPTESEITLAGLVRSAFPSMQIMRFVNSGTEAVMSALRLARGTTNRRLIVKFAGGYHGHSDGLLVSAGSGAATFGRPTSAGVPPEIARLTVVLPYNDPAAVEKVFGRWGREVAAVVVEPVAGNMGVVPGTVEFLKTLRRLTGKHGALLIFDEVITGFRLGWGGAQTKLGVRPDLTCLGKIVGGGFPVGVFGGARGIMNQLSPLGPVYQAGTLSGNPVAMAAGAATLRVLKKNPPYRKMAGLTKKLAEGIRRLAIQHSLSVRVNAVGAMFTVFFADQPVKEFKSALQADTRSYGRFFQGLLKRGIYFPPAQMEAAFLSAAHTEGDVQQTLKAVGETFRDIS